MMVVFLKQIGTSGCCKFADDMEIGGVANSEEEYLRLQEDVHRLGRWAEHSGRNYLPFT